MKDLNTSRPYETIKYLDEFEIKRFFEYLKGNAYIRDQLLFKFLYRYGLRASESVNLKLSDLIPSPERPVEIYIRRLKGGISRHYPIRLDDLKLLRSWLKERKGFKYAKENGWLFITSQSLTDHMSALNINKLMEKYGKAVGLEKEKRHPHVWRHSCAISLLLSGRDINFTRLWLGHSNIQTTVIYAEFAPPEWEKTSVEALENGFVA